MAAILVVLRTSHPPGRRRAGRLRPMLLGLALCALAQLPFPAPTPGADVGFGLPVGYEASGVVWHPLRQKLYVVGDGGSVARMEASGASVVLTAVAGDLE